VTTEAAEPAPEPEIRTLSSSVVYTDNWTRLRRDEIERADGSTGTYAVVERDNLRPRDPGRERRLLPRRGVPPSAGPPRLVIPAGQLPEGRPGGTAEELARTELAQETGAARRPADPPWDARRGHGMSDQYGEHWLATGLTQGEPDLEPEELGLRHAWVRRADFEAMARDGGSSTPPRLPGTRCC